MCDLKMGRPRIYSDEERRLRKNEMSKKWRKEHREERKAYKKKWYEEHPEYQKKWYEEHYANPKYRECVKKTSRKWQEKNKEKMKKYRKLYYQRPEVKRRCKQYKEIKRRGYFNYLIINDFPEEPYIEHHITDHLTAFIPKDLHELYAFGYNKEAHRFMCNQIIKFLYINTI